MNDWPASVTTAYALIHDAFADVAARYDVAPMDIRVLVAIRDRGGEARTDQLEQDMRGNATAIRRSSLILRDVGLITADAGEGTFATKRGTRARLMLSGRGQLVAGQALELVNSSLSERALVRGAAA